MLVAKRSARAFASFQAVAVHFPKQQRPILRADLPHLQHITRAGRGIKLEATASRPLDTSYRHRRTLGDALCGCAC